MKLEELKPKIVQWLQKMEIKNYSINADGSIDVNILNKGLTKIPIQFKYVGEDFVCDNNNFKSEPDHSFIDIGGVFKWK